MRLPKYCLFFDNHTMPACPDVGENFDAEEFVKKVKDCGVDYLTFHARCNMGMAYYDTKIGIKHPSLKRDLFGELATVCAREKILLTAYFNGGLSDEEGLRRREWTTVSPDGRVYPENPLTPYARQMCYNSAYADHLIAMVREVLTAYPVDGIFIDCLAAHPCIGAECLARMKAEGVDPLDAEALTAFAKRSVVNFARRIAKAATAVKPDLLMYFNGIPHEAQLDFATYLECECLPTGNFNYEYLPLQSRYMRTLGLPCVNMTGRFHRSWGDFGGIRTVAGIEYDCFYGLANGMRPNIGSHFHPRGDINPAEFELVKAAYDNVRRYEPWYDNAKPMTEIAVVSPVNGENTRKNPSNYGAARMLTELKYQFDIVTEFSDWDAYALLVLADDVVMTPEIARRVKRHLDAGKPVLSTGTSGLLPDKSGFAFPEAWGVSFQGDSGYDPAYLAFSSDFAEGLPDMPTALYAPCSRLVSAAGTRVAARLVAPYYNYRWDGEHPYYYAPPDKVTDAAAVVFRDKLAVLAFPAFKAYYESAYPALKTLVAKALNYLCPRPLVRGETLPSFVRVMATEQPGRKIVHLLSYLPERRGPRADVIEEPVRLARLDFALRVDGEAPKAYLAPDRRPLPVKIRDGYAEVTIPGPDGYSMAVFENA